MILATEKLDSIANGADFAHVSGQSRRSYPHLCGTFQQKSEECKAAAGKNNDWIRSLFT